MEERESLSLKGRIAEVLEGGRVLRRNLFEELKSIPETSGITAIELDKVLNEMLLDETVRKIVEENKGKLMDYWELNEFRKYFAYGSNMNDPDLKEGKAFCLENFRLGFTRMSSRNWKGSGVADIIPNKGSFCWGVVFEIDEKGLESLDEKEGVKNGAYERTTLPGGMITYTVPASKRQKFVPPSSKYLDEIIRGARKYGLPEEWIEHLESFKNREG